MQLEPEMRVRCVDGAPKRLTIGREYEVVEINQRGYAVVVDDSGWRGGWLAARFKPILRVKMRTCARGSNFPGRDPWAY